MKLDELHNILRGSAVVDVLMAGWMDSDSGRLKCYPWHSAYFLDLGKLMLRVAIHGYTAELLISIVPQVTCDFDVDEGMTFAEASVSELYLPNPDSGSRIQRVEIWGAMDIDVGVQCQALRLEFEGNQVLFFDPRFLFGMRPGNNEDQAKWVADVADRRRESIVFDDLVT